MALCVCVCQLRFLVLFAWLCRLGSFRSCLYLPCSAVLLSLCGFPGHAWRSKNLSPTCIRIYGCRRYWASCGTNCFLGNCWVGQNTHLHVSSASQICITTTRAQQARQRRPAAPPTAACCTTPNVRGVQKKRKQPETVGQFHETMQIA